MKSLFRMSLPMLAVAALAAACNPFAHKTAPQYPKDPRFSEFVFRSDEEPTVKDRTDSVNVRWPNMEASEAHLTIANSSQTGFLPDQDPEFWLTAVATVPDPAPRGGRSHRHTPAWHLSSSLRVCAAGVQVHDDRSGVRG